MVSKPGLSDYGLLKKSLEKLPKKKGEPLGRLSRSSGCIYLSKYSMMGMRGVTPYLAFLMKIL